MKRLLTLLLVTLSFVAIDVLAQSCPPNTVCVTANRDTTMNDNPYYDDTSAPLPSSGLNFGPGYGESRAKQAAAEKKGCIDAMQQQYGSLCSQQAADIKQSNLQSCSNQAKSGGVIAFVSAAGFGLAVALSGPVGWIVGAVSLLGGGGGTWYGVGGATSCRDAADAAYNYNISTACPNYVKNARAMYCPK